MKADLEFNTPTLVTIKGWLMLQKVGEGDYIIEKRKHEKYGEVITFKKPRGKKVIVMHYASSVLPYMRNNEGDNEVGSDNNYIEKTDK